MTSGYRLLDPGGQPVPVSVDGGPVEMSGERSLLASLLAMGRARPNLDFLCAIGQCQRCLCLIDGQRRASCLYYPKGGEVVETGPRDGRPPPWASPDRNG